jgi:hypothetical protein
MDSFLCELDGSFAGLLPLCSPTLASLGRILTASAQLRFKLFVISWCGGMIEGHWFPFLLCS